MTPRIRHRTSTPDSGTEEGCFPFSTSSTARSLAGLVELALAETPWIWFASGRTRYYCGHWWGIGTVDHEPNGASVSADGAAVYQGRELVSGE